jgi:glycosyltransferase involved in cell wall biosynthesis
MKNYQLIEKLGYPYKIASKENYIPHEKMPEFYNGLSVYTHFSSHEGGNRTILEACSCGIPVVSTEAGAVNNYIASEWIVPYRDDEEYLQTEFKNRKRVLEYDWKIITNNWLSIIQEVYNRVKIDKQKIKKGFVFGF